MNNKNNQKGQFSFDTAIIALRAGYTVKLPEWDGLWVMLKDEVTGFGVVYAITGTGRYAPADVGNPEFQKRNDWQNVKGLDFAWALSVLRAGKKVRCISWHPNIYLIIENDEFVLRSIDPEKDFITNFSLASSQSILSHEWTLFREDSLLPDFNGFPTKGVVINKGDGNITISGTDKQTVITINK